jgi:ribosomal protein L7/L12
MLLISILATLAIVVVVVALRSGDERVSMPSFGQAESRSIESLVAGGQKIEAIKLYRQEHGVGLREAKEAVDQLERSGPKPISP